MDEQNRVNFVSNLAFQSRRMTPGLPTRKKARISKHGKEEEEAEEKIPLTERNSSKIKAAQIKVAVPGGGCASIAKFASDSRTSSLSENVDGAGGN